MQVLGLFMQIRELLAFKYAFLKMMNFLLQVAFYSFDRTVYVLSELLLQVIVFSNNLMMVLSI